MSIYPLGEQALIVRWGDTVTLQTIRKVQQLRQQLIREEWSGVIELTEAQHSLTIHYDPFIRSFEDWRSLLLDCIDRLPDDEAEQGRLVEIPVCYGGSFGPDLAEVAKRCGLSEESVVRLHSDAVYLVAMIGFIPGFPYLLGLPKELAVPRRERPRTAVPAGSVGIGGSQSGIYPAEIPGGWQLIGRTPIQLFQPEQHPPSSLMPGDRVRFIPISGQDFARRERACR